MTKKDIKILVLLNFFNFLIYALTYLLSILRHIKIPEMGLNLYIFIIINLCGNAAITIYYVLMNFFIKLINEIKYLVIVLILYYVVNFVLNISITIYNLFTKKVFTYDDIYSLFSSYILLIVIFFNYLLIKKYFLYEKNK